MLVSGRVGLGIQAFCNEIVEDTNGSFTVLLMKSRISSNIFVWQVVSLIKFVTKNVEFIYFINSHSIYCYIL